MSDMNQMIDRLLEENSFRCLEGRRGLEAICCIARAIGYVDPMRSGTISAKATLGDLMCMLEDNPGLMEAMVEWIKDQNAPEWKQELAAHITQDDDNDDQD